MIPDAFDVSKYVSNLLQCRLMNFHPSSFYDFIAQRRAMGPLGC